LDLSSLSIYIFISNFPFHSISFLFHSHPISHFLLHRLNETVIPSMGSGQSKDIPVITIPTISKVSDDESPIYRNIHCFVENGGNFMPYFRSQPEFRTLIDIMRVSSVRFPDSDCTGERIINADGSAGRYVYITYSEFYGRALAFGRGLLELGLDRGDRIGVYSSNSQWWQLTAFSASSVGLTIVPVYDSLGKDAARYIINHSSVKVVVVSAFKFPALSQIASEIPTVTHILLTSDRSPSESSGTISVLTCAKILASGAISRLANTFSLPSDVGVIMYTSGSTALRRAASSRSPRLSRVPPVSSA
jgi:long-chain acyl-CoA synthetase